MMEQIFVSINGDDSKNGLTRAEAIKSWKRLMQLSRGNAEWVFMEGNSTQAMLLREELKRKVKERLAKAEAEPEDPAARSG